MRTTTLRILQIGALLALFVLPARAQTLPARPAKKGVMPDVVPAVFLVPPDQEKSPGLPVFPFVAAPAFLPRNACEAFCFAAIEPCAAPVFERRASACRVDCATTEI
jgi:hypothetical protein